MAPEWSRLPWDSDFFGFTIGSARLDGLDATGLAALDRDARDAGVECLYGYLDPSDAYTTVLVQRYGWRFIEAATTFELRTTEPEIPVPPEYNYRQATPDDIPALTPIALQMADWSRFAVDPRFGPDAARRVQMAWLERAARAETGQHSALLAEDDEGPVAFIGRVHEPPRVDAAGTIRRGSGAARALMQIAREWAGDRHLLSGPAAIRNVTVFRYVSHAYYRVKSVEYIYHRWLDEAPTG
ncbi:MAG: hypothetical protein GXY13_04680 [Acidimicrobiales bacterium]|nr:hypothetical protein [Acidimicrobiales bacterium]